MTPMSWPLDNPLDALVDVDNVVDVEYDDKVANEDDVDEGLIVEEVVDEVRVRIDEVEVDEVYELMKELQRYS
jgi:hypothetical protein